jgi:hypothetical protein
MDKLLAILRAFAPLWVKKMLPKMFTVQECDARMSPKVTAACSIKMGFNFLLTNRATFQTKYGSQCLTSRLEILFNKNFWDD